MDEEIELERGSNRRTIRAKPKTRVSVIDVESENPGDSYKFELLAIYIRAQRPNPAFAILQVEPTST